MAVPEELSLQYIQGVVETNRDADSFLAQYFTPVGNDISGPTVSYDILDYARSMARLTSRDGRAPRRPMPTRGTLQYKAPTIKESIELKASMLKDTRAVGSLDQNGRADLMQQAVRQTRIRVDQRIEWLRAQWLTGGALLSATGTVPGDADGNVYYDYFASAADAPLGPANLGALATHVEAFVPGAFGWNSVSADILGDLNHAAAVIEADSGITKPELVVLMNPNTHDYLPQNNYIQLFIESGGLIRDQLEGTGYITNLWGFEVQSYGAMWHVDTETMNDAEGTEYYIPDNVVVITAKDNVKAGRELVECEPVDAQAPDGARGFFAFDDSDGRHPHHPEFGLEWTGGPTFNVPDAWKVFKDCTATK